MVHDRQDRPLNISVGSCGSDEAKSVFHTVQFRACGLRTAMTPLLEAQEPAPT